MADLSDFFNLVKEEKKKKEDEFNSLLGESADKLVQDIFFTIHKEIKKDKIVEQKIKKEKKPKEEESRNPEADTRTIEKYPDVSEENLIERSLGLLSEPSNIKQKNDPLTPLNQNFITSEDLQKHYKIFIERIQQQLSTLGGGGETRLEFLDDVNRDSVKVDNKFLRYDAPTEKWIGAYAGQAPFISSTTYVTTSSYTITENDYYIGVNYAGAVTITLPSVSIEGTTYIVKDELGQASKGTNRYITILPSGSDLIDGRDRAILAFDYGSLTFVYRNGWRVV